jgi:hypothetical protein
VQLRLLASNVRIFHVAVCLVSKWKISKYLGEAGRGTLQAKERASPLNSGILGNITARLSCEALCYINVFDLQQ